MRLNSRLAWLLAGLLLACALPAAADMDAAKEQLARWQLNNADLLVDEGKYMQAVEYIDSAYEISRYPKTRSDALLTRAMVLATFLDAPAEAVATYEQLAGEFPAYGELAAYRSAFIRMQSGETERARQGFSDYLGRYPDGRFRLQAEAMLESLGAPSAQPAAPTAPAVAQKPPVLRVALARKGGSLSIAATGPGGVCAEGMGCAPRVTVTPSGARLSVNGRAVAGGSVSFSSAGPVDVSVGGNGKRVRGDIRVENRNGRLLVLNLISIEDYLLSVVPSESYASWPLETLKAQAVAARTYAYYQKQHRTGRDYDIVDDTRDQMYGGVLRENGRTTRAVQETAGAVLTYSGKPILAQYTANSGGFTADSGAVFDAAKPYLVAHEDPASLQGKMASWSKSYTAAQIVAALKGIGVDAAGLTAIEPAVVGPSGRLVKVRLRHARGSTVVRTRTTLASSRVLKLPEVLMRIDREGDRYVFKGKGHGHGVGYSQWGSAELGKRMAHEKILAFYYPHTSIETLWR